MSSVFHDKRSYRGKYRVVVVYRLGAVVLEGGGRERGRARRGGEEKKKERTVLGGEATSPFIKVSNAKCVAAERCFGTLDEVPLLTLLVSALLRAFAKKNAASTFNFFPFSFFSPFFFTVPSSCRV